MDALLILLVPIALLVLATHLLAGTIALREVRRLPSQLRTMSRRQRVAYGAWLAFGAAFGGAIVWAVENPSHWHTSGWVLLAVMAIPALWAVTAVPVTVWREVRKRRVRRDA